MSDQEGGRDHAVCGEEPHAVSGPHAQQSRPRASQVPGVGTYLPTYLLPHDSTCEYPHVNCRIVLLPF